MPLNIRNPEAERLAAALAKLTGETKTEAVRLATGAEDLNLTLYLLEDLARCFQVDTVPMLDKKLMRFDGSALSAFADLGGIATGPCNDMVVDAKGRAYVGNFGYDRHNGEAPRNAAVARVDPDGSVHVAAEDLAFPNGSVVTPDGKTLIVAETFGNQLTAFDIAADGALSNRRTFAAMGQTRPDGICLDAEGAVWVADAGGGRAVRVREGGAIAATIPLSPRNAYACMLGGDDGKTLFILTSSASGPANAGKKDARVETVRVSVPHAGLP